MAVSFETFSEWETHWKEAIVASPSTEVTLNMLHINIRSIQKHWNHLLVSLADHVDSLDILILTEINTTISNVSLYSLDGFQSFSLCRENRRGGGILMFVKSSWFCEPVTTSLTQAEVLVTAISRQDISFVIGAFYRPPSSNITLFFDELAGLLNTFGNDSQLVFAGDFNIDVMKVANNGVANYLNLLSGFGLENLTTNFTREEFLGNRFTRTAIDHVVVRLNKAKFASGVIKQKIADHYFVSFIAFCGAPQDDMVDQYSVILDRRKIDNFIKQFDWSSLLTMDHITAYQTMVAQFEYIYNNSKKKIKIKQRKSRNAWITVEIMELCHEKNILWNRVKANPANSALKAEFRTLRNKITAEIRLAKKRHYSTRLQQNQKNQKKTWQTVQELTGHKKKESIDETIKKAFSDTDLNSLSNKFNTTFVRSVSDLHSQMRGVPDFASSPVSGCGNSAYLTQMTEDDLVKIIKNMAPGKSPGADRIRLRDISANFEHLKHVLLKIINSCLSTGQIPNGLKIAVVRPIYKKGSRKVISNYRPISILPVISLILEKFVFNIMTSFCEKYSLLYPSQYGFRKNRGTITLLEDLSDHIHKNIDNNNFVLALFLDLTKAFDSINHKILIKKLLRIGFRGPFIEFLTDYLSARHQMVSICDVKSDLLPISTGVPQGSILGPLLFNIYVNDLGSLPFSSTVYQYADDTVLVFASNDEATALSYFQRDIHGLMAWFRANQILVNADKTKLMHFHNPHKVLNLSTPLMLHESDCRDCECTPLEYVSSVKYLGLFFDKFLNWGTHIDYLAKRLRVVSAYLFHLRMVSDVSLRMKVYQALGESVLRYGITIYGACSNYKKTKLDNILHNVSKNIAYRTRWSGVDPDLRMRSLLILSIERLYIYVVCLKHYYNDTFKVPLKKQRTLRKTERFVQPRIFTNYGKRVRSFYVPYFFNKLPDDLFCLQSFSVVKRCLKYWCLTHTN